MRQLEDLIMDAIYQNLINANLDQKLKQVEVHSAMGRDLRPGQAQDMLRVLAEWYLLFALDVAVVDISIFLD